MKEEGRKKRNFAAVAKEEKLRSPGRSAPFFDWWH
jgi:hypothetical protein